MFKTVSPELYKKYKDKILKMSNSFQRLEPGKKTRGMSDAEIAEKLKLDPDEVMNIRCIAELDALPLDWWQKAVTFKREEALKFINRRQQRNS